MTINFQSLRDILLAAARRHADGDHGWGVFSLAHAGRRFRRRLDGRAVRGLAGGILFPPAGRHGLLFDAVARPLPPALRCRYPSGPDRSLVGDQPADGFAAARTQVQGRHSDSAPSYGWSTPRQTVTTLRRTHRRVRSVPSRRQPARYPRLHRTPLWWGCLERGTAPF